MTPARHRSRHPARWAVVALACVLGQLLGVLHMGLIQHRRCAAHGELVEGGADELAAMVDAAPAVGQAAFVGHAQRGEHDHEHCQAPSQRATPRVAAFAAAPRVALPLAAAPPVARAALAIQGLFRLAPKASPPTVG
ncbi:MAG: hypothetical protein JNK64_37520 [Myxococcales bacterium]|nr:hypothetical protein [Myxococcales bacterium]